MYLADLYDYKYRLVVDFASFDMDQKLKLKNHEVKWKELFGNAKNLEILFDSLMVLDVNYFLSKGHQWITDKTRVLRLKRLSSLNPTKLLNFIKNINVEYLGIDICFDVRHKEFINVLILDASKFESFASIELIAEESHMIKPYDKSHESIYFINLINKLQQIGTRTIILSGSVWNSYQHKLNVYKDYRSRFFTTFKKIKCVIQRTF